MLFKTLSSKPIESWTNTTIAVPLNPGFFGLRTIVVSISCADAGSAPRSNLLPFKDVFDYTLEEIAELVDSTVGGVKAALNRARVKLAALPEQRTPPQKQDAEMSKLLNLYVERFNRRDWNGLRELIAADAQLRVVDKFTGRVDQSPYFGNYERWPVPWQLAVGEVDGEPVIIILLRESHGATAQRVVRLDLADGRITSIADYLHCPWILSAATSVVVAGRD